MLFAGCRLRRHFTRVLVEAFSCLSLWRDALSKQPGGLFVAKAGSKLCLRPGQVDERSEFGEGKHGFARRRKLRSRRRKVRYASLARRRKLCITRGGGSRRRKVRYASLAW